MTADWHDAAACADHPQPDIWHPKPRDPAREAKAICRTCSVAQECGSAAITDPSLTGVWGGMTDAERAALRPKKPRPIAQCGTHSGYVRHLKRGEIACDPCKRAKADYVKSRYRAADKRRAPLP